MITTAIFDVDGTLLDTNYLHVEAFAQAFLTCDLRVPRREIHRRIGQSGDMLVAAFVSEAATRERVTRLHREHYHRLEERGYPLPGGVELPRALAERGFAVWLATSAHPDQLPGMLAQLQLGDRLAGIVSTAEVDEAKPEPDIFQRVLAKAGCAPNDAVVVGDTVWDVEAALGSGLRTIGVLTGGAFSAHELTQAGAVAVYQDCAEVLASGFPEGF